MILLPENINFPQYTRSTAYMRQNSARTISRKSSSSFPLQPLDNNVPIQDDDANDYPSCAKSISRCNSRASNTSDWLDHVDLFSQLNETELADIARACDELDKQQTGVKTSRVSLFRTLSQQSANFKLRSKMEQEEQQQPLNQQVPYPYCHGGLNLCGRTTTEQVSRADSNAHGERIKMESVSTLMDFMDDGQNQHDMEQYLVTTKNPTLGEVNASVPSTGTSSIHTELGDTLVTNEDSYVLNENQAFPEYFASTFPGAPFFPQLRDQQRVPPALRVPTMAPLSRPAVNNFSLSDVSHTAPYHSSLYVNSPPLPSITELHANKTQVDVKPQVFSGDRLERPQSRLLLNSKKEAADFKVSNGSNERLTTRTSVLPEAPLIGGAKKSEHLRTLVAASRKRPYENESTGRNDVIEEESDEQNNQKREWWEYNVNHRGQRLDSLISRMRAKPGSSDPHVLPSKEDPVFDAEVADTTKQVLGFSVKHGGKARIGNGNDLTPRPERLRSMKNQLEELDATMDALAVARDDTEKERTRKRREKNRLASRVCRLKRKAQHEANKVMLFGLEKEHHELMLALDKIKELVRAKITRSSAQTPAHALIALPAVKAVQMIKQQTLSVDCDMRPQLFVNDVIEGRRNTQAESGRRHVKRQ